MTPSCRGRAKENQGNRNFQIVRCRSVEKEKEEEEEEEKEDEDKEEKEPKENAGKNVCQ